MNIQGSPKITIYLRSMYTFVYGNLIIKGYFSIEIIDK